MSEKSSSNQICRAGCAHQFNTLNDVGLHFANPTYELEWEGGYMHKGVTFKGKPFFYDGNINSFLKVYPSDDQGMPTNTIIQIDEQTINLIRRIVKEKSPIKMGACRDNPSPNSLLFDQRKSPQWLSYILPLLEIEGFLTHYSEGNAFWVRKVND